jgi:radical SAM protein with 4Fe4S-binding SPASM domain
MPQERRSDIELSELKFIHHLDKITTLAARGPVTAVTPVTVEIDPTNVCNSNCWWCSTAVSRREAPIGLSEGEVMRVIDESSALGARSVVFKGGGDPTLQEYLFRTITHAHKAGLAVGVNTNGVRMSDDLIDALVAHGSWARFSVDACTRETYKKVHRRDDFEAVEANLRTTVKCRNERGSSLMLGINNCLDQFNLLDSERLIEFAVDVGVDYVAFRPAYFEIAPTQEARLTLRQLRPDVINVMAHIKEIAPKYPSLTIRVGNIRNGAAETADPGACLAPALTLIVTATGDVAACCDLRGKPAYTFGNIRETSLRDIWDSDLRKEVFARTSRRECDRFCSHAYGRYNQIIDYLSQQREGEDFL